MTILIIILFAIVFILPILISLIINKLRPKLLFLAPVMELIAVYVYNAIVYSDGHGGVRFDLFFLMLGFIIATFSSLILLIIKKQHVLIILIMIFTLFILNYFLPNKNPTYDVIRILPFYIGVVVLSFQKNRI